MKKSIAFAAVVALTVLIANSGFGQVSANQTVNLTVNSVQKIAITGSAINLTITTGTAGADTLTPVTDNSTTYSITHNSSTALRITANLDQALATGYSLRINLNPGSGHGTSAGTVDISNATSSSAVAVVTGIPKGADANRGITYSFYALSSVGTLASTQRTVTLTLTN